MSVTKPQPAERPATDAASEVASGPDRYFGKPIPRGEDARLLSGNGRYLDDLGHNALIAAFVRSPHAHARITGIDTDAASELAGVHAIYTYED
ncbi:hypothetical protein ACWGT4_32260, partial [Streptomyces albidoflavus]